jgi:hypothetical protein
LNGFRIGRNVVLLWSKNESWQEIYWLMSYLGCYIKCWIYAASNELYYLIIFGRTRWCRRILHRQGLGGQNVVV